MESSFRANFSFLLPRYKNFLLNYVVAKIMTRILGSQRRRNANKNKYEPRRINCKFHALFYISAHLF